ncbi:hypothetical protein XENOCAPTIV_015362, partial [Xenoophorus captivus]
VIYDEKVLWWETIILISMYGIYIIIMMFNRRLCCLVERHCSVDGQPCLSSLRRTTAVGNVGDGENDMVPLKPGAAARVCTRACSHQHQKLPSVPEQRSEDPVTQFKLPIKDFCFPVDLKRLK